jgi:hypothetical protein
MLLCRAGCVSRGLWACPTLAYVSALWSQRTQPCVQGGQLNYLLVESECASIGRRRCRAGRVLKTKH